MFVVCDDKNRPMHLTDYEGGPRGGTLCTVTDEYPTAVVFKTREAAYRAIDRSQRFSDRSGFNWPTGSYYVVRLEAHENLEAPDAR